MLVGYACCSVILARFEPRRYAGSRLDLGMDPDSGASSVLDVAVRVHGGGLLQMRAAAADTVRDLCRAVADALQPVATDVLLSWNCARMSSHDGRRLQQVGMVDRSVIECALGMCGGMQGAVESEPAGARRGTNEQVRLCLSKAQSMNSKMQRMKALAEQTMLSLDVPRPIVSDAAAAMASSGRAASALPYQVTKVT